MAKIRVKGHTRRDGTKVKGHVRHVGGKSAKEHRAARRKEPMHRLRVGVAKAERRHRRGHRH